MKKRIEKYFPDENNFFDTRSTLLNTIRVPKNLLYVTDRLPKPNYGSSTMGSIRKDEEEKLRRKTHDAS